MGKKTGTQFFFHGELLSAVRVELNKSDMTPMFLTLKTLLRLHTNMIISSEVSSYN